MVNNTVYINAISKFLPNDPVSNDEIEDYLGLINGARSRSKSIILRNNGIKTRYYAIDKDGRSTHSNAELCVEAINGLFSKNFSINDMELLVCGTGSSDQMIPSHTSMVHGILKCNALEITDVGGTCNSGMLALKHCYLSVLSGLKNNAICTGSEKVSNWIKATNFEEEAENLEKLGKNPYIAFEKEFLRWMLSDGAAAALIQNKPNKDGISLRIDWIENNSFANELETCMYAGGIKKADGNLASWRDFSQKEQQENSVFAIKQDTRVLEANITKYGAKYLVELSQKHSFLPEDFNYFLPHMSSEFFRNKIIEDSNANGISIPDDIWFTNLAKVGNVGSASAYLMLEELFNSGKLNKGDKILLMVPESARFSYTFASLTVV